MLSAASQLKTTQVNEQTQPAQPSWELREECSATTLPSTAQAQNPGMAWQREASRGEEHPTRDAQPGEAAGSSLTSDSRFSAPQQPTTLAGDRLHGVPVVSWVKFKPALPFRGYLLRNPLPTRNSKCRPAVLCVWLFPVAMEQLLPRWCWVLKALAAAVGISSLMEKVRGKKRDAGFSSRFLCPKNDCGKKEATPALAGEAVLGLPAALSL